MRDHVQQCIQALLEEEVTELVGRTKSAWREAVDVPSGYRNGYGKPRRLTLTNGTITVRRPRVRDLNERFVSRGLPLCKRQTKEVGELLPQLYLHGFALGTSSSRGGVFGVRGRRCLRPCCCGGKSKCSSAGGFLVLERPKE